MKVKELMQAKVLTVGPEDTADKVFLLLYFEGIRHLPVVEKGKVVGMVSDRDLKKVLGSLKSKHPTMAKGVSTVTVRSRKVKTFMRRGLLTVSENTETAEAAAIMAKKKVGALPVLKSGKLAGIITTTDILRDYVRLSKQVGG